MTHRKKPKAAKWADTKPGTVIQEYSATDPRSVRPIGGMRIGHEFKFLLDGEMPRLMVDHVIVACENIVQGTDCYPSLMYLSRARGEDARTLFEATQLPDIRQRWERLWVLSPFFARLARNAEGRDALVECVRDDLAAVHLLSKFAEQKNDAVLRFFKRTHDTLLKLLLEHLVEYRNDMRRANLLSGIIATIETDGEVLRKTLDECITEPKNKDAVAEDILSLLYVKGRGRGTRLSSETLRRKLQNLSDE